MSRALFVPVCALDAYLQSYGVSVEMLWVYAKDRWGFL